MGFFVEYFFARTAYDATVTEPARRKRKRAARENGPPGDEVALEPGTVPYARLAQHVGVLIRDGMKEAGELEAALSRPDRDRTQDEQRAARVAWLRAEVGKLLPVQQAMNSGLPVAVSVDALNELLGGPPAG